MQKYGKRVVFLIVFLLLRVSSYAKMEGIYGTIQLLDSFDSISWRAGGDHHGPRTAIKLASQPTISGNAAELVYDFIGSTNTLNYCEYTRQIILPEQATHLGFWVWGDGSGHSLRVRVLDHYGEWFQYTIKSLIFSGWEQVYLDLNRPDGSWGGDGRLDWPLMFNSFVIDSKSRSFVGTSSIYVDELEAAISIPPKPLWEGFEDDPTLWQVTTEFGGNAQVEASSNSFSGSRALKVEYSALSGGALHLKPKYPIPILGAPLTISLRVLGATENCQLILENSQGRIFKLKLGKSYPGQWQALESSWQEVICQDEKVTLPLMLTELIIFPTGEAGVIYLDQLVGKSLLSSFQSGSYLVGEEIKINYNLEYEGTTTANLSLRVMKAADVVKTFQENINSSSRTLALGSLNQGNYTLEAWCLCGQVEILLSSLNFAVLAPSPKTGNSSVGVQTHYAQGKGKLPDNLELAQRAGAGFIRDEIYWGTIEKSKGVYFFSPNYDDYINKALQLGLKPLIILDYGNSLYGGGAPTTAEQLAAWRGYVRAVVQRYRQVKHWEIWNEFNGGMGLSVQQKLWSVQEKAQHYTVLLEEAAKVIREIDSDATIIGCATAGVDLQFISAVLDCGGLAWMDAISIHPYCYPASPEDADLVGGVRSVRNLIAAKGGEHPIWITEIGWPTHITQRGVTEQTQAIYLARMYTLLVASGMVETIFWYDLQDDGTDPNYNEHNFGLVRYDLSPKSGYTALGIISRSLWGITRVTKLSEGRDGLWHYSFTSPAGPVQILWSTGSQLNVTLKAGRYQITNIYGDSSMVVTEQGYNLTLTEAPVMIQDLGENGSQPKGGVRVELGANPLPAGKHLNVKLEADQLIENVSLRIYNLAGKEVGGDDLRPLSSQVNINWHGKLERGAYVLWLQIRLMTGEVIKEKKLFLIL